MQWLGSGSVERVRLPVVDQAVPRGEMVSLNIQVLGSNFEPSMDALIDVNVSRSRRFFPAVEVISPEWACRILFRRISSFISRLLSHRLQLTLSRWRNLGGNLLYKSGGTWGWRLGILAMQEQELRMLANLTGGEFVHISNLSPGWKPQLSNSLPTVKRRNDLASFWPLALALFLTAGIEWIWRRKKGLR